MRIDADGKAAYELTLLLTPEEARQAVTVLNQLLAVVPSEKTISENEFDDAARPDVGGTRVVQLVVYEDSATEKLHDTEFG